MRKHLKGPFEVNGEEIMSGRAAEREACNLASMSNPLIPVRSIRTGKIVSWGAYSEDDGSTFIVDA